MISKRTYIDKKDIKVLAVNITYHCEIEFDYAMMREYRDRGWNVYAINKEGVFFFLDNVEEDGYDWNKITKREC